MPDFSQFPLHAGIYILLATLSLVGIVLRGLRLMLQDFPKSIQAAVPPRTPEETRFANILRLPFLLILFLYPFAATFLFESRAPQPLTFFQLWLYGFGLVFAFMLWDLLVLDWLILCTITPRWAIIPGTEGNPGNKDYLFHFIGFLKGTVISVVVGLIVAGVVALL